MSPSSEAVDPAQFAPGPKFDFRVAVGVVLLAVAGFFTYQTIVGLAARRQLRIELAEISHVRYDLLNVDRWVEKLTPILQAQIDAIDLKAGGSASLRPTVVNALNHLLDDVKAKMSTPKPDSSQSGSTVGGLLGQGNALMANMMVSALRPHIPEYADIVLAELGKKENKEAVKKYIKNALAEGASNTFGHVDMRWYKNILQKYGCADGAACRQEIGRQIQASDSEIAKDYLAVLGSSALAFALLLIGRRILRRSATAVLLLFCVVLLLGGVLTPMIEVEAKISSLGFTFMGSPISFTDQVLYFQSKSVLEVFRTLVTMGRPDMWIVGVLVLMFSIVFPTLKTFTLALCLYRPSLLGRNRLVRFLALESSKWSMADVMALAIFMSFVAFNGLITNTMSGLLQSGAQLTIPTDSSKLLPGYYLFIGFCLAGLLLSSKLARGIQTRQGH
jgi:hypothetical protein